MKPGGLKCVPTLACFGLALRTPYSFARHSRVVRGRWCRPQNCFETRCQALCAHAVIVSRPDGAAAVESCKAQLRHRAQQQQSAKGTITKAISAVSRSPSIKRGCELIQERSGTAPRRWVRRSNDDDAFGKGRCKRGRPSGRTFRSTHGGRIISSFFLMSGLWKEHPQSCFERWTTNKPNRSAVYG